MPMASQRNPKSLYPQIIDSNPDSNSPFLSNLAPSSSSLYPSLNDPNPNPNQSSSSSLYPSLDMKDLVENLFRDTDEESKNKDGHQQSPVEETLIRIPGAILHLIDRQNSIELGAGELSVARIRQADNIVAVIVRIGSIQWPLARDEASVKLDDSHYFFTLHDPNEKGEEMMLNYGLTFAAKGNENLLKELDGILESWSSFSVQKVKGGNGEILDASVVREVTAEEVMGSKKEMMEERSGAYWTMLAPNVGLQRVDCKGDRERVRAADQGILWCGDVTVDRLIWGEDILRRRMDSNEKPREISKDALKRMQRFAC